jgi:hypothetical protein
MVMMKSDNLNRRQFFKYVIADAKTLENKYNGAIDALGKFPAIIGDNKIKIMKYETAIGINYYFWVKEFAKYYNETKSLIEATKKMPLVEINDRVNYQFVAMNVFKEFYDNVIIYQAFLKELIKFSGEVSSSKESK